MSKAAAGNVRRHWESMRGQHLCRGDRRAEVRPVLTRHGAPTNSGLGGTPPEPRAPHGSHQDAGSTPWSAEPERRGTGSTSVRETRRPAGPPGGTAAPPPPPMLQPEPGAHPVQGRAAFPGRARSSGGSHEARGGVDRLVIGVDDKPRRSRQRVVLLGQRQHHRAARNSEEDHVCRARRARGPGRPGTESTLTVKAGLLGHPFGINTRQQRVHCVLPGARLLAEAVAGLARKGALGEPPDLGRPGPRTPRPTRAAPGCQKRCRRGPRDRHWPVQLSAPTRPASGWKVGRGKWETGSGGFESPRRHIRPPPAAVGRRLFEGRAGQGLAFSHQGAPSGQPGPFC